MSTPRPPAGPSRDDMAQVAAACADAGQPEMAANLIREGVSLPEARTRLDVIPNIKAVLALGRDCPTMTAEFRAKALSGRMTVEEVRTAVLDGMADADAEIVVDNKRPTGTGEPDGRAMMRENMLKQIEARHGPEAAAKARKTASERNIR